MNFLSLLTNHTHYWGVPYERSADERLIQTCYDCGAERELKVELRPGRVPVGLPVVTSAIEALKAA